MDATDLVALVLRRKRVRKANPGGSKAAVRGGGSPEVPPCRVELCRGGSGATHRSARAMELLMQWNDTLRQQPMPRTHSHVIQGDVMAGVVNRPGQEAQGQSAHLPTCHVIAAGGIPRQGIPGVLLHQPADPRPQPLDVPTPTLGQAVAAGSCSHQLCATSAHACSVRVWPCAVLRQQVFIGRMVHAPWKDGRFIPRHSRAWLYAIRTRWQTLMMSMCITQRGMT